ncbi:hypothetical protein STEG23_006738, partial [Scotinomys teguina]
ILQDAALVGSNNTISPAITNSMTSSTALPSSLTESIFDIFIAVQYTGDPPVYPILDFYDLVPYDDPQADLLFGPLTCGRKSLNKSGVKERLEASRVLPLAWSSLMDDLST